MSSIANYEATTTTYSGSLSQLLSSCCRDASSILVGYYNRAHGRDGDSGVSKDESDPRTVVTAADLESEQAIVSLLRAELDCAILSEELGSSPPIAGSRFRAIIDPLDGSKNFVQRSLGLFGISIAIEQDGELVAGALGLPFFGETLIGERSLGAKLLDDHGVPVDLPEPSSNCLERARINLGRGAAGSDVLVRPPLSRLLGKANECVNYASCVVGLQSVLFGRLDGLVLARQRYWDFAAGLFLFRELGGHFGVFHEDWRTEASSRDLASATTSSYFNIIASLSDELYRGLLTEIHCG